MSDVQERADTPELNTKSLSGDIRDWMLSRLQHEQDKRPWNERGEHEQEDTVDSARLAAEELVRQCVELIAARGLPAADATLDSVTVKDGIKATVKISRYDENRHQLIDACGSLVKIIVVDPRELMGERAPVTILHDQMELVPAE